MKLIKTYIFQIIVSIVFVFIMLTFFNSNSKSTIEEYIRDFNSHWNISVDGKMSAYKEIPSEIKNETLSEVIYERLLPSYIKSGDSILFYTNHQSVEVFIGHRLVYEFEEDSKSKTPGKGWHIIRLEKGYVGTNLKIIITPSYKNVADYTPDFLFGKSEALLGHIIRSNAVSLFLCVILFVVGVLTLIGSILFKKELETLKYLVWLGFLSVMVSIWSLSDLGIMPLFLGHHMLNSQITYISLKLTYIPVVIYIRKIYNTKENRLLNVLSILSIADFFITILLQFFGIADFKETIIIYHSLLIILAIQIIYTNIKGLVIGKEKLKRTVKVHLISIIFVFICIAADLFTHYMFDSKDNAIFTKFGIASYILVLLFLAVNKSIKLIHSNEQLDRMKQIVSLDAITKLNNRTAFQEDINSILQADYHDYGVAVFDLNELKEFNDLYGHSVGDYYIIISSEILQDVFGKYGTVYRIGGDEFCAIMKNTSKDAFKILEDKMNKRIEGLNGVYFSKHMSIASGYAAYNPKYDISINDTFQRADKNMYKNKRKKKVIVGQ